MNMIRIIAQHEWRHLRARRTTWLALFFLAASIVFGACNGGRWADFQHQTIEKARIYEAETYDELANRLASPDGEWPDPTDAAYIGTFYGRSAVLPPAPLAPLAVGQSDLAPYNLYVSGKSLANTHTKAAEELGNPQAYVTGRFDTAFALVVVLPLVLLVLLFDVLSGERERGTLSLILSQPVRLRLLLQIKAGLNAALVAGTAVVALTTGLALNGADFGAAGAISGLLLVVAATTLYTIVWTALALWVSSRGWNSATNALSLASVWVLLVILLPGLIGLASGYVNPVPSRTALIEAERDAQNRWGSRGAELLSVYYDENPDALPADLNLAFPEFALAYTAVQGAIQDSLGPILAGYERALTEQEQLARRLSLLSPPALLQEALTELAGTGHARHAAYLRQVARFHKEHRQFFVPKAYRKTPLTTEDYRDMPRFTFTDPGGRLARILWPLGGLALFSLFVLVVAATGLRRDPTL